MPSKKTKKPQKLSPALKEVLKDMQAKKAKWNTKELATNRELALKHEQRLRNAAIDTQIRAFAEEEQLKNYVAHLAGASVFCALVWLELLWLYLIGRS